MGKITKISVRKIIRAFKVNIPPERINFNEENVVAQDYVDANIDKDGAIEALSEDGISLTGADANSFIDQNVLDLSDTVDKKIGSENSVEVFQVDVGTNKVENISVVNVISFDSNINSHGIPN